ncbi:hypothetical protein K2X30_11620 [bacterium]|jgi:stalled ribosome rescue protein Dom34|nr:hypothetical protein [bacterium]
MSIYAIWIDRENARIFHFSTEKMERKHLQSRHPDHHTHPLDQMDFQKMEHHFFKEICLHLKETTRLLILGPGVAKYHFQTYLMEQVPDLAKKLVACVTVDHPTDAQIGAAASKFFGMDILK